ncbi:helix-turn-helix transcriptional regulator [bacterium]|nr:helix-turn-helix transcriptional regulator [bacterium]
MGIKKELGKKIKKVRLSRGYTQERLSEMAEITQKALSSIEVGENFITAETLDKLLSALKITAEELFATDDVKDSAELLKLINRNIAQIGNNPEKLEIIYNLTRSLTKNL